MFTTKFPHVKLRHFISLRETLNVLNGTHRTWRESMPKLKIRHFSKTQNSSKLCLRLLLCLKLQLVVKLGPELLLHSKEYACATETTFHSNGTYKPLES